MIIYIREINVKILNVCKELEDMTSVAYNLKAVDDAGQNSAKKLIKISEKIYRDQIKKVANVIATSKMKLVLVSGPSSSGKTTTANIISQELVKKGIGSLVVSIDDFFVDLKDTPLLPDGSPDCENITAVDIETFNKFITELLTKHKAKMPRYNFHIHKRDKYDEVSINENDILIVEGIHALNPLLIRTHQFDSSTYKVYAFVNSIFVDSNKILVTSQDLRLMRRVFRDAYSRGRDPIFTINNWKNVCDGEKLYIAPFRANAHSIIDTTHPYEILVYANYLVDLLLPYRNNEKVKSLLDVLTKLSPLLKDLIPSNSLIWEFVAN